MDPVSGSPLPSKVPPILSHTVRRLNRAVLLVAALILIVTLLAAVFLAAPPPPPRATGLALAQRLEGGAPGFLRLAPGTVAGRPAGAGDAAAAIAAGLAAGGGAGAAGAGAAGAGAGIGAAGGTGAVDGAGDAQGADPSAAAETARLMRLLQAPGGDRNAAAGAAGTAQAGAGGQGGAEAYGAGGGPFATATTTGTGEPPGSPRAAFQRALRSPLAIAIGAAQGAPRQGRWFPASEGWDGGRGSRGDGGGDAGGGSQGRAGGDAAGPDAAAAPPAPPNVGPVTGGAGEGGSPPRRPADAAGAAGAGAGGGAEIGAGTGIEAGGAGGAGGAGAGIGAGAGGGPGAGASAAASGSPGGSRWEALAGHPPAGGEPLAVRYRAPAAGGTVAAGTLISATLLTAVDSGLPGPLLAQVSRDVYDGTLRQVVIPRGTRLLGRYQDQVAAGQNRLLVAWTRFLFADGGSVEVAGLPAADATGAAGLPAQTDNHLRRVFGDAVLLSLLGAGAQLSQPAASGFATAPSSQQVAAAALGQELSSVGLELVRRDLAVQPTLRVPAGTPFFVFVTADLPGTPRQAAGSSAQGGPP